MNKISGGRNAKENAAGADLASGNIALPANETLLLFAHPDYRPPTPDEIRAVIQLLGMTAEQIARLVGVKDGRAVRRWLAPSNAKTHAQIDYAIWRLMLLAAGLIDPLFL